MAAVGRGGGSWITGALVAAGLLGCSGPSPSASSAASTVPSAAASAPPTTPPPTTPPPITAPSSTAPPTTASPALVDDPLEPLDRRCGGRVGPGQTVRMRLLRSTDGARLVSAQLGTGVAGVLLVHESGRGAGACGWWTYARELAAAGSRVELVELRCAGRSSCPETYSGGYVDDVAAAVAHLRAAGARRVALVGASYGGAVVLAAATRVRPPVSAVVDLSGTQAEEDMAGTDRPLTVRSAAVRLDVPLLWAVAPGDPYADLAVTRRLFALVPSRTDKRLLVRAGAGHGWAMVSDPVVGPAVRRFLADRLGR